MSATQQIIAGSSGALTATGYCQIGEGSIRISSVEATVQQTLQLAGTFSNLYVRVSANSRNGNWTIRFRKNGGNGNQVVTVTSSTTGEFEDTSNSDAIVATDYVNISLTIAGSSGSTTFALASLKFTATTNTTIRYGARWSSSGQNANQTTYGKLADNSAWVNTTEASAQSKMKVAGTWANLYAYAYANTLSGTCTIRSRKNGADGYQVVIIAAGNTGLVTDISDYDTLAVDDLVDYKMVTASGTGAISVTSVSSDFTTTTSSTMVLGGGTSTSLSANTTYYTPPGGSWNGDTTEANVQTKSQVAFTASNLLCYISANSVSANSTLRFRIGGANGNLAVTITASTTGWFEDTSNSDSVAINNEINISLATGATGTTMSIGAYGYKANFQVSLSQFSFIICVNKEYPHDSTQAVNNVTGNCARAIRR